MQSTFLLSAFLAVAIAATAQSPKDTLPGRRPGSVRFHDSLPEVTIKGYQDGGTVRGALRLQKAAVPIVDIVPEESIARSSDLTVADVTRRVGGLSVTTDNAGQSDHTIIRGMDPKYNYTLIDGIKIPSPGDRSRYIPLSIFPADIVQRVEVYKTLTPDMEGDAIGGVVNMVLRNAPADPFFKIRLTTGYNQTFFDQSYLAFDKHIIQRKSPYELHGPAYPATNQDFTKANLSFYHKQPTPDALGSLTWGRRFFKQKAGLLLAADYQDIKRGTPNFFIPQTNQPGLNNSPGLTDFYKNNYSTTIIREGLHAKIDYVFNPRNSIGLYQFYASQQDIESRYRVDTGLSMARSGPGTGRIELSDRSRTHFQHIYSNSLRGVHTLSRSLSLRWISEWSVATGLYPDWAELSTYTARQQVNGYLRQDSVRLDGMTRTWLRNRERDLSDYVYLDYHLNVKKHELSIGAGGMYRDKKRDNLFTQYNFSPAITSNQGQPFTDIYHAVWLGNGPIDDLGSGANSNTFTAHEYISAGYVSFSWKGPRADWTGGIRYEDTRQSFVSSIDPTQSYGHTGSISYHDYLPSLQVKYRLTDQQLLRASYYKSLSRPALYDVTFYSIQYEDYLEVGNPFLKRSKADNFDLRYEWYPGGLDLLQGSLFYKHIANPYEQTLLNGADNLYPIATGGQPYVQAGQLTSQMRNAADAHDYGLELSVRKYIGRLGLQADYTYTYSHIVQPLKYHTRQDPNNTASDEVTVTRNESRPLQGQSPHLGSLSLLYQDEHHGWNARISAIYTGRRIYSASEWYDLDYWQRGCTVLDAMVEKRIGKRTKVFAKVNNLFNTITTVDLLKPNPDYVSRLIPGQERSDRLTVMKQTDKAVYYVGFQYRMP